MEVLLSADPSILQALSRTVQPVTRDVVALPFAGPHEPAHKSESAGRALPGSQTSPTRFTVFHSCRRP